MAGETNLPVRVARERRKADDWSLVLTAADIEHDLAPAGRDWLVLVGDEDLAAALAALDAYDHEQRVAKSEPPPPIEYGPTRAGLAYAAALLLFYFWVERIGDTHAWEDAGRAYAARIAGGEWWRAVTALTLHANFSHVLGNVVAVAIFGGALSRMIGPGTALWILLLSGCVGNLVNAYLRAGPHAAVGASTSVFGAVGALAGLAATRRYRSTDHRSLTTDHLLTRKRKAWVPLGAAMALLAMLGVGEQTDIWAHLFGLVVGLAFGAGVACLHNQARSVTRERGLVVAAVLGFVGCWVLAF